VRSSEILRKRSAGQYEDAKHRAAVGKGGTKNSFGARRVELRGQDEVLRRSETLTNQKIGQCEELKRPSLSERPYILSG